jgi:transcriptional regulator GlxA family with amidase domain
MHELTGKFTPVEDLAPPLARGLMRAMESRDPASVIESFLAPRDDEDPKVAQAVRRIVESSALDISALARELNLSTRQLERRFQTTVGLPPKLFSGLQRFNRLFRALEEQSGN